MKVGVEIEGGIWVKGAHVRGKHFESDCEKYNAAAEMGWLIFRYSPGMMRTEQTRQQLTNVLITDV